MVDVTGESVQDRCGAAPEYGSATVRAAEDKESAVPEKREPPTLYSSRNTGKAMEALRAERPSPTRWTTRLFSVNGV